MPGDTISVMLLGGALAGLAGAVEVLGVHYRLIEGFSLGFGFNAVAVALLGALNPLAVIPAACSSAFWKPARWRCSARSACRRRWSP